MIDVKLNVRKAFYNLLSTAPLSYQGNYVPVVDEIKALSDNSDPWVIMSTQTGTDASTFQTFDSDETIILDIVHKAGARTNKAVVDNVAGQILNLVIPAPGYNGLLPDASIQINCVRLMDDKYMSYALNTSNSVMRRLLTYKMRVRQTGTSTPPTPIPSFTNPIVAPGAGWANATDYDFTALKGKSFLLYLNGTGFLTNGVQWNYLAGGGFTILLNNFDATVNSYVFYLLLQ